MKKMICFLLLILTFEAFAITKDYKISYINISTNKTLDQIELSEFIENPSFNKMYFSLLEIVKVEKNLMNFSISANGKIYLNYYNGDDGVVISCGLFSKSTGKLMKEFTQIFNSFKPQKNKSDIDLKYKVGSIVSLDSSFCNDYKNSNILLKKINPNTYVLCYSYKAIKVGILLNKSF